MIESRPLRAHGRHGSVALPRAALRPRGLSTSVRSLCLAAALVAGAIMAGWLVAHGDANYVAGGAVIAAAAIVGFIAPAPLAAALLLVALNGVPIVNLDHRLPGNLQVMDLAVFGLAALLLTHQDRNPSAERSRIIRAATIWSACFAGWWTYEFARSFLLDGIPWLKAFLFCRDFLYFAILLPLALRARLPARSLLTAGVLLLVALTLDAIGQDVQSITGVSIGLVHTDTPDANAGGLTRLYADSQYLIDSD